MSGEKPAPTAAEISKARDFLDDRYLDNVLSLEFPRTVDHIRTLLAALDAAEAREKAAEKTLVNTSEALRVASQEVFKFKRESVEWREAHRLKLDLLATAERERDELRDALKLYEAFPELATGDTARRDEQRAAYNGLRWVLGLLAGLDDGRQDSVAKAFRPVVEKIKRDRDEARAALKPGAIVVSDSPETVERVARELWLYNEGENCPWSWSGESGAVVPDGTKIAVREQARAALAALRESRP